MTQAVRAAAGRAPRGYARWAAELALALVFVAAGAVVVNGSLEQGVGWTATGPESGFFPFRIGILIVAVGVLQGAIAIVAGVRAHRHPATREVYLHREKLRPLLQVFLPMAAYVAAVPWLGLYIGSAIFIAGFMAWQGGYRWRALPTAIAICAVFYVLLEAWFKVELYKGPLAEWLLERLAR